MQKADDLPYRLARKIAKFDFGICREPAIAGSSMLKNNNFRRKETPMNIYDELENLKAQARSNPALAQALLIILAQQSHESGQFEASVPVA